MSVNKVILIGRLGNQPELRYTTSNRPVTELRLATDHKWTSTDGERQEKTEWHTVIVWGRDAENCERYLSKGRQVYVEGRLETRNWEDKKSGTKRYKTEVTATMIRFLAGGRDGDGGGGGYERSDNQRSAPQATKRNDATAPAAPGMGDSGDAIDDDVPF